MAPCRLILSHDRKSVSMWPLPDSSGTETPDEVTESPENLKALMGIFREILIGRSLEIYLDLIKGGILTQREVSARLSLALDSFLRRIDNLLSAVSLGRVVKRLFLLTLCSCST